MKLELLIEIESNDRNLIFDIMGSSEYSSGKKIEIPGNAYLISKGLIVSKAFDFPETIELILSFGSGVASGIVASWLYDKIKGRSSKLSIERTQIELNEGEIEKILIEKIKQGD